MLYWLARPWRRAFDFGGRSPRREYWLFVAQFYGLLFAFMTVVASLLGPKGEAPQGMAGTALDVSFALFVVALLCLLVPMLAVAVRRVHDHDKTGWLLLLGIVPAIGWIFTLIMMLTPGSEGENGYGPDPRDKSGSVETMSEVFY